MATKRATRTRKAAKVLAVGAPVAAGMTLLGAEPAAAGTRGSTSQSYTFTTTGGQQVTCTVTLTTENANYQNQPNVAFASFDIAPNTAACRTIAQVPFSGDPGAFFCAYWVTPKGGNGQACEYYTGQFTHGERLYAPVRPNSYFEVFFAGRFTNCANGQCNFSISHQTPPK